MSLLEVENISRAFGKLVAVKDVSLSVEKGSIHGLIGPNGSGKTTTFNVISGFLKPTSGKVRLAGVDIGGRKPHSIARMGLIRTFQLTSVYPSRSVAHNIKVGLHHALFENSDGAARRVDELLDLTGLTALRDTLAASLPAGSQRVLSIATAMAASPRILLLDEPLAGLNANEKADVVNRMRRIRDGGCTILLVEHDVKSIFSVSDRITAINFGERIAEGTAAEVARNKAVVEAYLGNWDSHAGS